MLPTRRARREDGLSGEIRLEGVDFTIVYDTFANGDSVRRRSSRRPGNKVSTSRDSERRRGVFEAETRRASRDIIARGFAI